MDSTKTWKARVAPDAPNVTTLVEVRDGIGRIKLARFVIDTGTPVTILDRELAVALGLGEDRSEGPSRLLGPTGPDQGYRVTAALSLMGREFSSRQIRCHHLWSSAGVDGLVGLDMIRMGALKLDLPWGLVEFTWN